MQTRAGFTLVELSIVLVIIGLIIGGVLVGRDLINQAELRSVISDIQRFTSAAKTFRLKYNCLPGDCPNASSLGLGTNGNGNGTIDDGWCAATQDTSTAGNTELFLFWQHLGNADLIPGTFTGQPGAGNAITSIINTNVPASGFPGGGYAIGNVPVNTSCAALYFANADYTNVIFFGAQRVGDRTVNPLLTPHDAFNVDQKLDDGLPGTGSILTLNSTWFGNSGFSSTSCVTTNSPSTAIYSTTYQSQACHLIFNHAY